jgi:hypothetical protein
VHVYCGPTITAAEVLGVIPDADVHPPVRHGDLLRLDAGPGDTVVIIDGVFHNAPAVRHKEILDLLARGVRVVGGASMGALRAAELHAYGMAGVGSIFAAYRDGLIDADDEVAVVHAGDDHRQLSEALADIRAVIATAETDGVLHPAEAARLVGHARAVCYAHRTWPALRHAATADPCIEALLERLDRWRGAHPGAKGAKHADAVAALRWAAAGNKTPRAVNGWAGVPWRNSYVQHWIARYRGRAVGSVHVPFLAILQHQQLYDPGFPRRWRRHILSWVANTAAPAGAAPAEEADIERSALAAAEAKGLALRHLSQAQLGYWLTDEELDSINGAEKLARILVRSASHDPAAAIWPAAASDFPGLINAAIDSATAAAAAFRRNEQVARSGPGRTVHELRADKVRRHLSRRWGIDPDEEQRITAAARDRGFHHATGAVEAARSFFLSGL